MHIHCHNVTSVTCAVVRPLSSVSAETHLHCPRHEDRFQANHSPLVLLRSKQDCTVKVDFLYKTPRRFVRVPDGARCGLSQRRRRK